jgi:hypothetical protein
MSSAKSNEALQNIFALQRMQSIRKLTDEALEPTTPTVVKDKLSQKFFKGLAHLDDKIMNIN